MNRMRSAACLMLAAVCGGLPAATSDPGATPRGPLNLVPAESLLCWKGLPPPDMGRPGGTLSAMGIFLDASVRIAGSQALKPRDQITLRLIEAFGEVIRYPFALALLDAKATSGDEAGRGTKVDDLKLVLVTETAGDNEALLRIIQKIVGEQTDEGQATLERKRAGAHDYQELYDQRLPKWCRIAWGTIGRFFVITLGDDVWPQVARVAAGDQTALSAEDWVRDVRGRYESEPLIEVVVAAMALRERLDPFVHGRASDFFRAWEAEDVDRAHWGLGFDGRALYCRAYLRSGAKTILRVFADPAIRNPNYLEPIPDGARYAIYKLDLGRFFPRLVSGYLATRSPDDRAFAERIWKRLQEENGFDAEKDILSNLGDTVVLHNQPLHPLRIPIAFTSLIEIREDPEQVRKALETLIAAWQAKLDETAEKAGIENPVLYARDDDGVWRLQVGPIELLSWAFTDRFIVTSWSQRALRTYLDEANGKAGKVAR